MIAAYDRYAKVRDEKKLNDCKVAKATGITQSTFSDWKSGRSKPKIEKLIKLSEYFKVPITEFLGDEDDESKS